VRRVRADVAVAAIDRALIAVVAPAGTGRGVPGCISRSTRLLIRALCLGLRFALLGGFAVNQLSEVVGEPL